VHVLLDQGEGHELPRKRGSEDEVCRFKGNACDWLVVKEIERSHSLHFNNVIDEQKARFQANEQIVIVKGPKAHTRDFSLNLQNFDQLRRLGLQAEFQKKRSRNASEKTSTYNHALL